MKVILSGATGFIGREVLAQALAHPSITSLVCLSRRALPESVTTNPKVNVIIVSDFTSYPPETLAQLEGAEACIWYVVQYNCPPQQFQHCNPTTEADSNRALGSPAHKNPNLEDCGRLRSDIRLQLQKPLQNLLHHHCRRRARLSGLCT
jgi:hypothetical protein